MCNLKFFMIFWMLFVQTVPVLGSGLRLDSAFRQINPVQCNSGWNVSKNHPNNWKKMRVVAWEQVRERGETSTLWSRAPSEARHHAMLKSRLGFGPAPRTLQYYFWADWEIIHIYCGLIQHFFLFICQQAQKYINHKHVDAGCNYM